MSASKELSANDSASASSDPEHSLADCPHVDVAAVPDLMIAPDEDIAGRHSAEVAWLRERHAAGTLLATACTGSMLLAEAGLLDAKEARDQEQGQVMPSGATGMSPLEYVHTLRLEESKELLETTDLVVEGVGNEVGYEDVSFFGRLFRRKVGITPAQYRRRFGTLRKALAQQQGREGAPVARIRDAN